jgi:hypothetical protein
MCDDPSNIPLARNAGKEIDLRTCLNLPAVASVAAAYLRRLSGVIRQALLFTFGRRESNEAGRPAGHRPQGLRLGGVTGMEPRMCIVKRKHRLR